MKTDHSDFLGKACELALDGIKANKGGPFGAVVVLDGKVIGSACNEVLSTNDPIAHAEINAIREACKTINNFHLEGAILYCTCEPCPMCLAAMYWARIEKVIFASSKEDAAHAGFDDLRIYEDLGLKTRPLTLKMELIPHPETGILYRAWMDKTDKVIY
ncbi:MAG TPA: tRNA-specific adenosine deaminase [Bacteroidetes bacterium]|nr:tRNA-specific adenosine deaminase [Bacteroidota bacterium]